MGGLSVILRHPWLLLLAVLVSAGVAVPLTLRGNVTYESKGTVLIPAGDPVTVRRTQASLSDVRLDSFAKSSELQEVVVTSMGPDAHGLLSLTAERQRSPDFFGVTATARTPGVAMAAVSAAAKELIAKANELAASQVDQLREVVAQQRAPLADQRSELVRRWLLQRAEINETRWELRATRRELLRAQRIGGNPALQERLDVLSSDLRSEQVALESLKTRIDAIDETSQGLDALLEGALQFQVTRQATSTLLSPPSRPMSGSAKRLVESIGLAAMSGLVVAALVVIWVERKRLMPSRSAPENGQAPPHEAPQPPKARERDVLERDRP